MTRLNEWYADVDARLLQLADQLEPQLGDRIRRLVDADALTHDVIDLRDRAERAEDLAHECRRQLTARNRECERLQIQLAQAEGGVVGGARL